MKKFNVKIFTEHWWSGESEDHMFARSDTVEELLQICYRFLKGKPVDIHEWDPIEFEDKLLEDGYAAIATDDRIVYYVQLFN